MWLRRLAAANYDLRAWRTSQDKKGGRSWAEGFAIMDLDDGAAWDFACSVRASPPDSCHDSLKPICGFAYSLTAVLMSCRCLLISFPTVAKGLIVVPTVLEVDVSHVGYLIL